MHPNVTDKDTARKKLRTAYAAEELKFKRYCGNYHVQKAQIKPLVFETFGGWTENIYEYLYNVVKGIAGADDYLFTKLWRKLRNRIGVTLARGEGELILRLNALNPSTQRFSLGGSSPSVSCRKTTISRSVRSGSRSSASSSRDRPTTTTSTTTTTTKPNRLRRESKSKSSPGGNAVNRIRDVVRRLANR